MAGLLKRGKTFYAVVYEGRKQRRICLRTSSRQLAKDKLRQIESAQLRGEELPLPTRTPLHEVLSAYLQYITVNKTRNGAYKDAYKLRDCFGPACPELAALGAKRKRPLRRDATSLAAADVIRADALEVITTPYLSDFIARRVRTRGLSPKTANHYREILSRLFNWACSQRGVKLPGGNPAARLERYRQTAPEISFLTLPQIDEQLSALADKPQLQTMVAMFIYAGLRREEAMWLRLEDVDLPKGGGGLLRIRAKTVEGAFWQPKTKKNRAVPISKALRAYLDRYTPSNTELDWYFPSPQGMRWDVDDMSTDLRAANAAKSLTWSCLDYRHTFGSQLAMKGESLFKIATIMGNSPQICQLHYAALSPESLVESVEF